MAGTPSRIGGQVFITIFLNILKLFSALKKASCEVQPTLKIKAPINMKSMEIKLFHQLE